MSEYKTPLGKAGLFNDMEIKDAYQYVDEIVQTLNPEDRITAYTAAYVLYNSVIRFYDENMVCTSKSE